MVVDIIGIIIVIVIVITGIIGTLSSPAGLQTHPEDKDQRNQTKQTFIGILWGQSKSQPLIKVTIMFMASGRDGR